jgi:hypothetical protein
MTGKPRQPEREAERSKTDKPPADWTTGDEPLTGAQSSYLHALASAAERRWRKPGGKTEGAESERARALGPGA